MPVYEYRCSECGVFAEVLKEIDQAANVERCPTCLIPMQRIYSPAHIIMIGANVNGHKYGVNECEALMMGDA